MWYMSGGARWRTAFTTGDARGLSLADWEGGLSSEYGGDGEECRCISGSVHRFNRDKWRRVSIDKGRGGDRGKGFLILSVDIIGERRACNVGVYAVAE